MLWGSMLRVLTLSTLFPHAAQPTLGVFVERQVLGLAALDDVEVEVVSPVGLPPWPLTFPVMRSELAEVERPSRLRLGRRPRHGRADVQPYVEPQLLLEAV